MHLRDERAIRPLVEVVGNSTMTNAFATRRLRHSPPSFASGPAG
jgi:hypothetical protein